ncbi:CAP domain-containing protein [Natronomonas sp. F2-12]|uniref:CAP domain-containing protein n=1 Tax=Natronomonas aquatica TaxID=2841590 RepID=A0A9R1D7E2_9EURY|nr:CAP domain-containing protein [Natronomonas aquatica]MCQ4334642.1 CAP domain-containing protein [Natronomonas aquatica]
MHFAEAVARDLHHATTDARQRDGRSELTPEQPLIDAAIQYARSLSDLGHITHDHRGSPASRVRPYRQPGENLACVQRRGSPEDVANYVVKKWLRSKPHRENLLNNSFSYHGIGVWESSGELYIVQLYAGRKPLRRYAADAVSSIRG